MRIIPLNSTDNAHYKRWKKISETPRSIKKLGVTLAEGAHLMETALEKKAVIRSVVLREKEVSAEAVSLFEQCRLRGNIPLYTLPASLFELVSPIEHGVGIFAELAIPSTELPTEPIAADAVYLDGVQDAGNVGTIMRTALASGIRTMAFSPKTALVWSPKVLRAAMGAHFSLTLFENVDAPSLVKLFAGRRLAADARGGNDLFRSLNWEQSPTVWIFGSEGQGISDDVLRAADERFLIPIEASCESLNVAAAAAVCLFEQRRRRRA